MNSAPQLVPHVEAAFLNIAVLYLGRAGLQLAEHGAVVTQSLLMIKQCEIHPLLNTPEVIREQLAREPINQREDNVIREREGREN